MNNPLSPNWKIDRDVFSESTEWMLGREPWLVRVAPVVGLILLVVAIMAAERISIPSPEIHQVVVAPDLQNDDLAFIRISIPKATAGVGGNRGDRVILNLRDPGGNQTVRLPGTIRDLIDLPETRALQATIELEAVWTPTETYIGTIYILGDEKKLIDVLLEKYMKRRRG